MEKIAFLGLGQMGAPMATRLLQAGHELVVWNRTSDRAKPLAAGGATVAESPAEAGAGAAFAITMVATPEALKEVVLGEHGLVRALGPGQVYIDMSTVGPHTVRSIAARFPEGAAGADEDIEAALGGLPDAAPDGRVDDGGALREPGGDRSDGVRTDGRHVDVHLTRAKRPHQAVLAQHHLLQRLGGCHHRDRKGIPCAP